MIRSRLARTLSFTILAILLTGPALGVGTETSKGLHFESLADCVKEWMADVSGQLASVVAQSQGKKPEKTEPLDSSETIITLDETGGTESEVWPASDPNG